MTDGGLGRVVGTVVMLVSHLFIFGSVPDARLAQDLRLRLRNVDNGTGHAANEDHAARALPLHEMTGDGRSKQVCAVDVDAPELAHAVNGVVDSLKVLREAGRGDEVINLAVLLNDLGNAGVDGRGIGNVGVVSGDFGDAAACFGLC